ncbi:unnamed protein product [Acanthosepion pharaonis]|uniref:Uncharacterized protein n=1 Tax=Acanthosepion pharaonis TaxID=158019 RepID=A0A812EMX3_ACAPH|nr:unnamed protein product [Sepia pharaonis]
MFNRGTHLSCFAAFSNPPGRFLIRSYPDYFISYICFLAASGFRSSFMTVYHPFSFYLSFISSEFFNNRKKIEDGHDFNFFFLINKPERQSVITSPIFLSFPLCLSSLLLLSFLLPLTFSRFSLSLSLSLFSFSLSLSLLLIYFSDTNTCQSDILSYFLSFFLYLFLYISLFSFSHSLSLSLSISFSLFINLSLFV